MPINFVGDVFHADWLTCHFMEAAHVYAVTSPNGQLGAKATMHGHCHYVTRSQSITSSIPAVASCVQGGVTGRGGLSLLIAFPRSESL
jgi:hypothetical protein